MATKKRSKRKEQEGDVIGISHPKAPIPHDHVRKGGHPAGIEIEHDTGIPGLRDVPQGTGATGVDLGGSGRSTP